MGLYINNLALFAISALLAGQSTIGLAQDAQQPSLVLAQNTASQRELEQAIRALRTIEPGDGQSYGLIEGMIARGMQVPCLYQQGEHTCSAGVRKGITAYSFKIKGSFHKMIDQQGPTAGYVIHYNSKGCIVRKFPMGSRIELKPNCDAELVYGGQRHQLGPLCHMKNNPTPPVCSN